MPSQAQFAWRAFLTALLVACTWLAFDPSPPTSADTGWDKLNHALAFGALAFAAQASFPRAALHRIALALLGYGAFIELVQAQIPERSAEFLDLLGDAAGIVAGLLLAHARRRIAAR
jgi:VanZ family protein